MQEHRAAHVRPLRAATFEVAVEGFIVGDHHTAVKRVDDFVEAKAKNARASKGSGPLIIHRRGKRLRRVLDERHIGFLA